MAKKNTGKVIQMLSPENYIRKKARSLPVYKCLINPDWEDGGMANLIVSRSHTNGNLTLCFYLVDLYCLGVKDTHFKFNINNFAFQEILEQTGSKGFVEISYTLAHNIVFAGIEFAEEYGFKPHQDFTSITQFLLEEDTEDIDLIEIECGKEGKPFYVSGPFDDQAKINKIMSQLERTAGPGNYDFMTEGLKDEFEDDWREDDENLDELNGLSETELHEIFMQLTDGSDNLNEQEIYRLDYVTNMLFNRLSDPEIADKYFDEYIEDLDIELTSVWIPDEMLGIASGKVSVSPEVRELFMKIYVDNVDNPQQARKLLEKFKKQTRDIPASYYLELQILKEEDSPEFSQKLKEYYTRFPEYSLLKLNWLGEMFSNEEVPEEYLQETYTLQSIFPGREELHTLEMFSFLMFKLTELMRKDDVNMLEGFCQAFEDLDLSQDELDILDDLATIVKSHIVQKHLRSI